MSRTVYANSLSIDVDIQRCIFIPTRGRPNFQPTLSALLDAGLTPTLVFSSAEDVYSNLPSSVPYLVANSSSIAEKRQFIFDHAFDLPFHFQIDDDLKFFFRIKDTWKLKRCSGEQLRRLIFEMTNYVSSDVGLISIANRTGFHAFPRPFIKNGRPGGVNLYVAPYIEFDSDLTSLSDFDLAIRLLRSGRSNYILTDYAFDQITQKGGGCSTYRTVDTHAECARKLASKHPGFVDLVQKENKTQGEFGRRIDVKIWWSKLARIGRTG